MGGFQSPADVGAEFAKLNSRIAALERSQGVTVLSGTPTTTPNDGSLVGDSSGPYLWLRVGGAWKRTAALV